MKTIPIICDFAYSHSVNNIMQPCQHIFDFYNGKSKVGTLVCHKSELNIRPNYDDRVLAIDFLEVTDKNHGVGTKILEFAEEYSKQIGCKGFMTLKADSSYMPEKIPHIFYRKFGFSTLDKRTDRQLDKFVKHKSNATKKDFPCLLMHYPAMNIKKINRKFSLKYLFKFLKIKI